MRTSALFLLGCLLLARTAVADESIRACKEAIQALETKIRAGDAASWQEKHEAFKAYKTTLEEASDELKLRKKAARDGDPAARTAAASGERTLAECTARYKAIQPTVATALRRDSVPLSGWVMGIFGACLLWGGFFGCMMIARRSGADRGEEG